MHVCLFVKRVFAYDVIISTQGFVYAQTMGKPRMLYIRKFYVVQNICINLSIFIGGTQGHKYNGA